MPAFRPTYEALKRPLIRRVGDVAASCRQKVKFNFRLVAKTQHGLGRKGVHSGANPGTSDRNVHAHHALSSTVLKLVWPQG